MASNNLGTLVVRLLATSDQFEEGLAKAASATAKFGDDVIKKNEAVASQFTRTNEQWENYLRLGDKPAAVTLLGKELRNLGHIVGGSLGGAFFRLAGNMERVWKLGKHLGGMKLGDGSGGLIGMATRAAGVLAAGAGGWKLGTRLANATAPGYKDKDEFGRSNSIAERIGRLFSEEQAVGKTATAWQRHYKVLLEGRAVDDEQNARFFAKKAWLEKMKLAAEAATESWQNYYAAASGKLYAALGGDQRDKADIVAGAIKELEGVTDQTSKWDKLTKKITEARQAIDWLAAAGREQADPEWLTKAGGRINQLEDQLKELRFAEENAAAGGGGPGGGGGREFKTVDSLSRLASGGASVAGDRQTSILQEINAGIKNLNRSMSRAPVAAGAGE